MGATDLELIRVDGRLSIEHQLAIHINDLFDLSYNLNASNQQPQPQPQQPPPTQTQQEFGGHTDLTLMDVLQGLRYVMDYRIRGGKQPSIEAELMRKLAEALVAHMKHKERLILIRQQLTPESDLAFSLFSDFLEEVEEFRLAVSQLSSTDLMHAFKIHRRTGSTEQQRAAVHLLMKMRVLFPQQYGDWRDLVKPGYQSVVEDLMNNTEPPVMRAPSVKPHPQLFPPPSLYFDRKVERLLDMFQTDPSCGLKAERVALLRERYGPNRLPEPPKPSVLKMLWTQLTDFMVLILLLAAIVSSSLGDFKSGLVLLIVVLFNVSIGFIQEYKANKALEALLSLGVPKVKILIILNCKVKCKL
jgi:Ca2+-transporting ATPase